MELEALIDPHNLEVFLGHLLRGTLLDQEDIDAIVAARQAAVDAAQAPAPPRVRQGPRAQ